jgi:hypothetical protein
LLPLRHHPPSERSHFVRSYFPHPPTTSPTELSKNSPRLYSHGGVLCLLNLKATPPASTEPNPLAPSPRKEKPAARSTDAVMG